MLGYSGDLSVFDTVKVCNKRDPSVTVSTSNMGLISSLTTGVTGTFTATHADAKLASGGAILYTLNNAIVENTPSSGDHAAFGKGTVKFMAVSSDGTTSPLVLTRV